MRDRVTMVACFDEKSNLKIEKALKHISNEVLCKVPMNINYREKNDTLPYHVTLSAWDIKESEEVLKKLKALNFTKIEATFKFDILELKDKSMLLYLKPLDENCIRKIQCLAYQILPTEKYRPENYKLHTTININNNHEDIERQYLALKNISLKLVLDKICLFEIYPANEIGKIKARDKD